MKNFSSILLIFMLLPFTQCKQNEVSNKLDINELEQNYTNYDFDYASTIEITETDDKLEYSIHFDQNDKVISIAKEKLPLKKLVVLSSSTIGFLAELDQLDAINAVYGAEWMYNPDLHKAIKDGTIDDAGNVNSMNLETILAMEPDAIIAYSDPNQSKIYSSLEEAGIKVIYVDEYREQTPLGKAEFIKLYGALTGSEDQANKIFQEVESNYLNLVKEVNHINQKPTVFAEIMRGDVWYMPGGDSFVAQYFEDAGADYLWSNDSSKGSIQLNFEQVFSKAGEADIWLNAADLSTMAQLQNAYKNHDWFQAFKNDRVYSIYKRHNASGANDYFEKGTVRADLVLKDLISICHPTLYPEHELLFYHHLN